VLEELCCPKCDKRIKKETHSVNIIEDIELYTHLIFDFDICPCLEKQLQQVHEGQQIFLRSG
jgi:hypothetical protein